MKSFNFPVMTQDETIASYKIGCNLSDKDFDKAVGTAVDNAYAYCIDEGLDINIDANYLPMFEASLVGAIADLIQ